MNVDIRGTEVVLSGNLDTKGSEDLRNVMGEILENGAGSQVVIDFASVPFVSSAGLRVLLIMMKKLDAGGGALSLKNVGDSIKEVFNMTGFSSIFKII